MKLHKRIKRTTKQYILVSVLSIVVIGGAALITSILFIQQVKEEYRILLDEVYADMEANKRNVYVATSDIISGDILTDEHVEKKSLYSSQPQDSYITEDDIGKIIRINITENTQILKSMITENDVEDDIREVEFATILISSNMLENDVVDIRIAYPNGEDYAVLAKKVLKGYMGDRANCFLRLTEEEIIRIHNAIVDAYLYTGSYLYTTKYLEPNLQEATVVTYTPSIEAINLIKKNPNIITSATNDLSELVRKALENRLSESLNKDVRTEQWQLKDDNIYQEYDKAIMQTPTIAPEEFEEDFEEDIKEEIKEEVTPAFEDINNELNDNNSDKENFNELDKNIHDGADGNNLNDRNRDGPDLGTNTQELEENQKANTIDDNYYLMIKEG